MTEPDVRQLPKTVVDQLRGGPLYVVEEHVREGGLGMSLAAAVLTAGHAVGPFIHRHALRYPSGRFGSQQFHRRECGLDAESLHAMVKEQTA